MTSRIVSNACGVVVAYLLSCMAPAMMSGQEILSPEQWALVKIDGCRAQEQQRVEDLARVGQKLQSQALSREEQEFPALEAANYAKLMKREGKLRLGELEFLLFRKQEATVQKMFVRSASTQGGGGSQRAALLKAVRVMTETTTACTLNALEATLFIAAFGLPLHRQWTDSAVNASRILEEVEIEYGRRSETGTPPEQTYLDLRERDRELSKTLVKALLQRILETSPERDRLAANVQQRLFSDIEEFFHLSAEPLRIEMLVDVQVGDFERYFGIRSKEGTIDHLKAALEKALFRDLPMLQALEARPPAENLRTLDTVVDKWLQKDALPELKARLHQDPFASHWFYVQTGMVARRPFAFRGASLRVGQNTPDLGQLRGLSFDATQRELIRLKVPSAFVSKYLELEKQLTDFTLPPDELLQRAERQRLPVQDVGTLKKFLQARPATGPVSTLDFTAVFVRDASRFQGKPNRDALLAGLEVFRRAKLEEITRTVDNLPAGPEREALASYLRTAGEWMLELEQRQANEERFQFSTGGGFIGWILRRTVIGNGLPVELWAPGGVTGDAFARLVDDVVPASRSGHNFHAKPTPDIQFLDSGETYYQALIKLINESGKFLNIQQHDWKLDRGGREIAYRLMAKKLGLSGTEYDDLVQQFGEGIRLTPAATEKTLFYDLPTNRIKNLLFYKLLADSDRSPARTIRERLEQTTGEPLACPTVRSCGDLSRLYQRTGKHYDPRRSSEPGYAEAWQLYGDLESLFDDKPRTLQQTNPRRAFADYVKRPAAVRGFVGRYGLMGTDTEKPFEVNIIGEGKRDTWSLIFKAGRLHNPLFEFNVRYLPWKGAIEYPWHISRVPLIGRWNLRYLPLPYVPWPWLQSVPKLGWTGLDGSLGFQHLMATDARNTWGILTHSKHVSDETTMLESGMGFASKYFNLYPGFRTWHDTGVIARGPITGDANDQYVQWFNQARHNNRGIAESHGVRIPRLNGEAYDYPGADPAGPRAWIVTTDPDARNYNYRGIFMAALAAARENIYIENAFYADRMITRMLIQKAREFRARVDCSGLSDAGCTAKKRDAVNIYLVLPLATDQPLVDAVGRSDYYEMINEGVKLYLWHPREGYAAQRMLHTKAWLVDYRPGQQGLTYVGSHNADRRSLWSDNEMGLLSASPAFADSVHEKLFVRDMQKEATRITVADYEIERRVRPVRKMGRLIRTVVAEIFWAF